jgi:DNA sulfur modification protein DndB
MDLNDLIDTEAQRRAEYGKRKKHYTEKTVHLNLRQEHEAEGWIHVIDLQSGAKMRKAKTHDELLENRVWCILYQLGYPMLNAGRKFQIEIAKSDGKPVTKQVDVFAKDDETVIVLECKSCEEMQERDLRKDIGELASLQKPIANAVRQHFGRDFKPKILWGFATWNIIWKKTTLRWHRRTESRSLRIANCVTLRRSPVRYGLPVAISSMRSFSRIGRSLSLMESVSRR